MTKTLSKDRILEIIQSSEDMYVALLGLYKEVLSPVKWEDIKSMTPSKVHVNMNTSQFILEEFHRKFTKDNDSWPVNGLFLNKGFSSCHTDLEDWKVELLDGAYVLNDPN